EYDDDDDPDDDVGVTEIGLRDHAERYGKPLEDMVIPRSDPHEAESMREAAMRQFMERQASKPSGARAPQDSGMPSRLNLRRRRPLRPAEEVEQEPQEDEPEVEPEQIELEELERQLEADGGREDTPVPPGSSSATQLGLMVADRAIVAERRAELAEERAQLAEERASLAEARAHESERELVAAAQIAAGYEGRAAEAEEKLAEAEAKAAEVEAKAAKPA